MPFLLYTPRSLLFSVSLSWMSPQTGNMQLPSLLIVPTVLLESFSPYSLFPECCLYFLDFNKTWHSPEDTSFSAQKDCTLLPGHPAKNLSSPVSHFCIFLSETKISYYQTVAASYFNFHHSLWPQCSQCPRFPSLWYQAPWFLSTSCSTIILDDFSVPEENPSRHPCHNCLQLLLLFNLGHFSHGYPAGCSATENSVILNSHSIPRTFPIHAPLFLLLAKGY